MRIRLSWITLLGVGLLAWPALAQDAAKPADDPPAGNSAMKQKLLDNFDTNKDGTIDRSEARAIGRALRENFNIGPGGPGPGGRGPEGRPGPGGPPPSDAQAPEGRRGRGPEAGPPPGDRGPRGPRRSDGQGPDGRGPAARGPAGRGPGGPEGPPPPPRPERLFNRFDENKDGSLSKEEFLKLSDFMRERFAMMGPPMMGRGQGRGFDGPPPRGDFQRRGGEGRRRGFRGDGPPRGPDGPPPPADPPAAEGPEAPI